MISSVARVSILLFIRALSEWEWTPSRRSPGKPCIHQKGQLVTGNEDRPYQKGDSAVLSPCGKIELSRKNNNP